MPKKKIFKKKRISSAKEVSDVFVGLIQAALTFLYITLLVLFMSNGEVWIGKLNSASGPVLFLSLAVISVLFLILILFAYPLFLYSEKKVKKALGVVGYSFLWLLAMVVIFSILLAVV